MKELKLALLGFGNAGQAFGRLLLDKEEEIKKSLPLLSCYTFVIFLLFYSLKLLIF